MPADPVLSRDEARQRAKTISDLSYDVDLDLTSGEETFRSVTRATFAAEPGSASFIDLTAAHVHRVELNGHPVPAEAIGGGRIRLDGLAERNELLVEADCAYERTGVGLHRFHDPVDGGVYLHTQFEPFDANRVYACFDQPDLKATFSLSATAPREWELISNGPPTQRDDDAEATRWRFAPTLPISTYLTALVAGPLRVVRDRHGDLDLGWWARASLHEHVERQAEELFTLTKQGFDFYTDRFGVAYPFGADGSGVKRYDQLFVPEFNFGAMENPAAVTFNEGYVFRSKVTDAQRQSRASTILHELAHMWFGNLVTMRWWDDLWLNESFATYMGHRALAEATRFTDAWAMFAAQLKAWAIDQDQLPSTHPITADLVDTDAIRTHFDGITYAKGASVLKQLVAWVGDEAFYTGLRDYFDQHAYGNAELADFLGALETASGRDLQAWSAEWLQTSGVATLRPQVHGDDGTLARVSVAQEPATVGDATLRRHRLALGCYDRTGGALVRTRQVALDVDGAETVVTELAGAPRPDLLLVNDDDAAFAKLRLDETSVATLHEALGDLDDPLASAVSWGALWDMVRDAELPARDFVALAARHTDAIADLTNLQLAHRRTVTAVDRYGASAHRDDGHARLLAAARPALAAAEPGSGRQLAWVRHLAHVGPAHDVDHRRWLVGLLQGGTDVAGLEVDTDLRWQLVVRLAADGAVDEDAIAAELERDPTDMGVRHAATARAARPGAGSKEHAWQALLGDRELPLATLRAMAAGFWRYGQEAVLEAYAARYPEALEAAWTDRVLEASLDLTRALYPSTVITDEVVQVADEVLADPDLPTPARRVVAEERDHTLRALRARRRDA